MTDTTFGYVDESTQEGTTDPEPTEAKRPSMDMSLLGELAQVARKEFENEIPLPVDERRRPGGWVLKFDTNLPMARVRSYQRRVTNNGKIKAEDADQVKANAMALIDQNTGIFKGDEQVYTEDGEPLLLNSMEWLKIFGQSERNPDTVKALVAFLGDAQILSMGVALMKSAGYGDDMTPLDPTFG